MAYVNVEKVVKNYGDKKVLNDISFEIKKGEIFGLIGPNGAGKTTLIDIITGLKKADSGNVEIKGISIKDNIVKIRESLGLVPQDIALMEEMNGRDNLMYFGGLYGLSGSVLKERVEECLKLTGLKDKAKTTVKTYSGGMKRRLNIAAALLHNPEFLILDEPTVGVDPQSRKYIFDFLREKNKAGCTILYISHYMEEIEALCDRILLMDKGEEVAYGTKEEIKAMVGQANKIEVRLDRMPNNVEEDLRNSANGIEKIDLDLNSINLTVNANDFSMMKLISYFEKTDSVIKAINVEDISLEEAFLQLTGKSLRD